MGYENDLAKNWARQEKAILGGGYGNQQKALKRSLSSRDKQILYMHSKGKCQNPYCKRKIAYPEMQVGHKKAYSKGGSTTLSNSICLCYTCNKLQGTDSWEKFLKKQATACGQAKPKEKPIKRKPSKKKQKTSSQNSFGWNVPKFRYSKI